MDSLKLEKKVVSHKNKNSNLRQQQNMISHEYRTPLSTSLMLLDTIQDDKSISDESSNILWLIITQINMLLCLVNDQLDIQTI